MSAVDDVIVQGKSKGHGHWELRSETESVHVTLPPDAAPLLLETNAGGEVVCDFPAEGGADPELIICAEGDIRVVRGEHARARPRDGRQADGPLALAPDADVTEARHRFGVRGVQRDEDSHEERMIVFRMLEGGQINAEEAARLLDALSGKR